MGVPKDGDEDRRRQVDCAAPAAATDPCSGPLWPSWSGRVRQAWRRLERFPLGSCLSLSAFFSMVLVWALISGLVFYLCHHGPLHHHSIGNLVGSGALLILLSFIIAVSVLSSFPSSDSIFFNTWNSSSLLREIPALPLRPPQRHHHCLWPVLSLRAEHLPECASCRPCTTPPHPLSSHNSLAVLHSSERLSSAPCLRNREPKHTVIWPPAHQNTQNSPREPVCTLHKIPTPNPTIERRLRNERKYEHYRRLHDPPLTR